MTLFYVPADFFLNPPKITVYPQNSFAAATLTKNTKSQAHWPGLHYLQVKETLPNSAN